MKHYDFDTAIPRRGTQSVKWDTTAPEALPMWVADTEFSPPGEVIDALRQRLNHPVLGYGLVPDGYYDAIVAWMETRHSWAVDGEAITVCPGVMPSMRIAIDAFTEPGDGIVVQTPVYYPFYAAVTQKGRRLIRNPLRLDGGRYGMDLDGLERVIDDGTRMLLLCSPHNPVGRVWSEEELAAVADIASKHDLVVISDEIHADIVYPGRRFVPYASVSQRADTIICHAPSKTFNIAGLAHSYTIIEDKGARSRFRKALAAAGMDHPHIVGPVAAEAAYRHGGPWLDALLAYLHENAALLQSRIDAEIPGLTMLPLEGTFIPWLDFRSYGVEYEVRKKLETRVRLSPGSDFGPEGSGFMRVNIGCPRSMLDDGINRIRDSLRT